MKKFNRVGGTFTTVVAGAAALAVFGTSTAVAGGLITSAKIKNNTVKSIDVRNNTLKGVDVRDAALTGADIADGTLSNQDVGVLFASVHSTGIVGGSSGGVSAVRNNTGFYTVTFPQNITTCAISASVVDVGEEFGLGYVNAGHLGAHGVFVGTKAPNDANADLDFQLIVVC